MQIWQTCTQTQKPRIASIPTSWSSCGHTAAKRAKAVLYLLLYPLQPGLFHQVHNKCANCRRSTSCKYLHIILNFISIWMIWDHQWRNAIIKCKTVRVINWMISTNHETTGRSVKCKDCVIKSNSKPLPSPFHSISQSIQATLALSEPRERKHARVVPVAYLIFRTSKETVTNEKMIHHWNSFTMICLITLPSYSIYLYLTCLTLSCVRKIFSKYHRDLAFGFLQWPSMVFLNQEKGRWWAGKMCQAHRWKICLNMTEALQFTTDLHKRSCLHREDPVNKSSKFQ